MNISKTFQNQSGIIRNEIIRPKRVFSQEFTLYHQTEYNEFSTVVKRKHFELADEKLVLLDKTWRVFSPLGFIQSPSEEWIVESFSFPYETEFLRYFSQQKPSEKYVHLNGMYLVFTNVGYTNYYHVMTELVPRLEFWLPFKGKVKLLIASPIAPFLAQVFEQFGISDHDIFVMDEGISYSADVLMTIPWGLNFIPERFQFVKKNLSGLFMNRESPKKRWYISREGESKRKIRLEDRLLPVLESFGFERIFMEKLPLAKQIQLSSEAEWICGPHGAGLTNLLWMNRPNVFEIRPVSYPNDCFLHLSLACGGTQYAVLEATADKNQVMSVDPEQLSTFFDQLML